MIESIKVDERVIIFFLIKPHNFPMNIIIEVNIHCSKKTNSQFAHDSNHFMNEHSIQTIKVKDIKFKLQRSEKTITLHLQPIIKL